MLGEEREEPRCGNRKIRHFYRRKNLDFTGFCDSAVDGQFIGAVEIYYDITTRNQMLNGVVFRSSLIPIVLMFCFLVVVIMLLLDEEKTITELPAGRLMTRYQSPFFPLLVIAVSIFVAEGVVMLFLSAPQQHIPTLGKAIFDSALLVLMVAPVLYFFLARPLMQHITERIRVEEELQMAHSELERRVEERTADLREANEQMQREIAERMKVEGALRESESKFRSIVETGATAEMGIFLLQDVGDEEGVFQFVNDYVTTLSGYSREELLNMSFYELLPDDEVQRIVKRYRDRQAGKEVIPYYETEFITKDGKAVPVGVSAGLTTLGGKIATAVFCKDITEHKRAEAKMKMKLMKFTLEGGNLYLVEESSPGLSLEAFKDLLKVGYRGLVISRTPEEEFRKMLDARFEFLWLAEQADSGVLSPIQEGIKMKVENLPRRTAVLIDRLDYLIFKNGFGETLSFIQHLREFAYLKGYIVILSIDPSTLKNRERTLLEKETRKVEPVHKVKLGDGLLDVLRFVYVQNNQGMRPSYNEICTELGVSKPTVRRRMKVLISEDYVKVVVKGSRKLVTLTEKGTSLFSR
jgi:PAS domain S-box-containing protein